MWNVSRHKLHKIIIRNLEIKLLRILISNNKQTYQLKNCFKKLFNKRYNNQKKIHQRLNKSKILLI